jgi:hypothetical protein
VKPKRPRLVAPSPVSRSFHSIGAPRAFARSPSSFPPLWKIAVYVCELTKRKYRGRKPREIRGPDDVVAFVGTKLRKEQREHFLVLLLNARHEVMARERSLSRRYCRAPPRSSSCTTTLREIPNQARRTSQSPSGSSKPASSSASASSITSSSRVEASSRSARGNSCSLRRKEVSHARDLDASPRWMVRNSR